MKVRDGKRELFDTGILLHAGFKEGAGSLTAKEYFIARKECNEKGGPVAGAAFARTLLSRFVISGDRPPLQPLRRNHPLRYRRRLCFFS
jgi:hypothetical protein